MAMRRTLTMGVLFGVLAFTASARELKLAEEHGSAGMAAYWRLDFQAAAGHFQAAVDADPQSAAALYYLGYSVYKIAEPKRANDPGKRRAAELFARAYEMDPGFQPRWGVSGTQ
jgi:tetratricopeptide (TPR) repeat protein